MKWSTSLLHWLWTREPHWWIWEWVNSGRNCCFLSSNPCQRKKDTLSTKRKLFYVDQGNETMEQKECLRRSSMIFQATLLPTCWNISGYFREELDEHSVARGRQMGCRYWTQCESPLTLVFWRALSWDGGLPVEDLHPQAQWPWSPGTTCHIWHRKLYPTAVHMQSPSRKWKKNEVCDFDKHIAKCLERCVSVQTDEVWELRAKAVTQGSKTSNYN